MKIGILGGSFDPVHNGHIEMAVFCKKKFNLDKVMLLPLGDPPHKRNITNKEIRLKMLEAAVNNLLGFYISRLEVDRPGKTYTFDTIKWLKENTKDQYFYIIGGDTVNTLDKWYNAKELFKILDFIVVDRTDFEKKDKSLAEKMGAKLYFANHIGLDVSSTEIRNKIKKGESIDDLVPQSVKEIIKKYELYKD